MAARARLASTVLLACGVALVFFGISAALRFSGAGLAASAAAIVGLLYAGGTWFGGRAVPQAASGALLFAHDLRTPDGLFLPDLFPSAMRDELTVHCRLALDGQAGHFTCDTDAGRRAFDVAPVTLADGSIACGVLLSGVAKPVSSV